MIRVYGDMQSTNCNRIRLLQSQFFEQYSHEPYIGTACHINKYLGLPKEREAEYQGKQAEALLQPTPESS